MLGIIVQLLLSWGLVWLLERKNLSVLGLMPTAGRLRSFLLFFFVAAIICASGFLLRMYFAKQSWTLNPGLSWQLILEGTWWNLKSVIFEELIFRGVLLYLLIRRWGALAGITISAIAFGMYHWFSHEVIGNIPQMVITFLTTGAMGVVYAYGYAKSWSLYIPSAIHLGWNLTSSVLFSETVIGNQLLVRVLPDPEVTLSYGEYYFMKFFPFVCVILVNFIMLKKMKQVEISNN
jgi:membrane protease YdiL (CAAX protease family)